MSRKDFESPVDDYAIATITMYDSKSDSHYNIEMTNSWCGGIKNTFQIHAEKGEISMGYVFYKKEKGAIFKANGKRFSKYYGYEKDAFERRAHHTRELQFFAHNILQGKPSEVDASYALLLQEMISIQYFAKLMNKEVTVDEMDVWGNEIMSKYTNSQEGILQISKELIKSVDLL